MKISEPIYAIIYANGRAETMKDGATFWGIMDLIYREYHSAGSNWNRPAMLLKDGKIVVTEKLADLAWDYGKDLYHSRAKASAECQSRHRPDWL